MKIFVFLALALSGVDARADVHCDTLIAKEFKSPCESFVGDQLAQRGCTPSMLLSTGPYWTREINAKDYEIIAQTRCGGAFRIYKITARSYSSGACSIVEETKWDFN